MSLTLIKMTTYERQDSNGLGWADEWDRNFDDDVDGTQRRRKSSKMEKLKAAASSSVEKTKTAATHSAQKMKSGTSTSLRWVKDKVHRKK